MEDCIFCKIVRGEIPSAKVYEDQDILAFNDIHPVAPVHVLIVPKKHVSDIMTLSEHEQRAQIMESVIRAVPAVAKAAGVAATGFRLINNCGEEGGQTVMHLHFHLIGGRKLGEKLI